MKQYIIQATIKIVVDFDKLSEHYDALKVLLLKEIDGKHPESSVDMDVIPIKYIDKDGVWI